MNRDKFTVNLRNLISSTAAQVDSAAAIEGSKMSVFERTYIKGKLMEVVNYIDKAMPKPKKAKP